MSLRQLRHRLDLMWCAAGNQVRGAWSLYRAYRTVGLPSPYGRYQSARRTWQCREMWD